MATKKNSFISTELEWAEEQLHTWRAYVDKNPLDKLLDRVVWKETKAGGSMPMVASTIESQGKFIQDTMKNYLSLLSVVDELREKEAQKQEKRGGGSIAGIMDDEE